MIEHLYVYYADQTFCRCTTKIRFCSKSCAGFAGKTPSSPLKWRGAKHRRSQDFVWGCTFFPKSLRLFLVVALKDCLNLPQNLSHVAKTVLKLTLALVGGALTHFHCKLGLKKFFHRPGGCRCTHCTPLATPMVREASLRTPLRELQRFSNPPPPRVLSVLSPVLKTL